MSYFRCCDNICKVINFIDYQLRYSLGYTLKNKHKMSSIQQVFLRYGKDIEVVLENKRALSFPRRSWLRSHKKAFLLEVLNPFIYLNSCFVSKAVKKFFS